MSNPRICAHSIAALTITAISISTGVVARADDGSPAPPPIVVVIYPSTNRPSSALRTDLVQLRDDLRTNPRIEVLAFDPDAPTFVLAARDADLDLGHIDGDDDRARLAQSLGAQLSVTVASGHGPDSSGNQTVNAAIRAVKPTGPQPPGVMSMDDSVLAAAQIVDEQVMVIDAANAVGHQEVSTNAPVKTASATPDEVQPAATAAAVSVQAPAGAVGSQTQPPAEISTPEATVAAAPIQGTAAPASPAVTSPLPSPSEEPQPPVQAPAPTVVEVAPAPTPPVIAAPAPQGPPAAVEAAPSPQIEQAPPAPTSTPSALPTPLTADAQSWMSRGDDALAHADTGAAIEDYRQAVNSSPRNAAPRISLTKAYIAAGDSDMALDELQRAVTIEPGSSDLQSYLQDLSKSGDLPGADTILLQLQTGTHPTDAAKLLALGDAYWNSSRIELAEQSYMQAAQIHGGGATPYARLARLYAASGRYSDALSALSHSGNQGYPAALKIIKERAETLIGDVDGAVQDFKAGTQNQTDFYNTLKTDDAHIVDFADFIGKIKPPQEYKVSYLHRLLAANLLAQMTPDIENYALTKDSQLLDQATSLERSAEQELSEANVADKLQQAVTAGG
jgi:Flp pilus assembly protein TadD